MKKVLVYLTQLRQPLTGILKNSFALVFPFISTKLVMILEIQIMHLNDRRDPNFIHFQNGSSQGRGLTWRWFGKLDLNQMLL